MNPAQVLSVVRSVLTLVAGVAVTLGVLDTATATQVADHVMQFASAVVAVAGAAMALGTLLWGVWTHAHPQAVKEAAKAITDNPTAANVLPVVNALEGAGATVQTGDMVLAGPAPTPVR